MSAIRNPYYQLLGGTDLPGDVRVSDTADASKTAANGWAASPAAVAETQTYHKYTNHSAESNVTINSNFVFVTGKNVDVYISVNLSKAFDYGVSVIKDLPKPVATYALATFVSSDGTLRGFGWISPGGTITSPADLPAGMSYIVAHYTTY